MCSFLFNASNLFIEDRVSEAQVAVSVIIAILRELHEEAETFEHNHFSKLPPSLAFLQGTKMTELNDIVGIHNALH